MDKSAIQQIQETANTPEFLKQLNAVGFPVAALPESLSLHDLEKYMLNRNQFRGVMQTANIDEYVRYHEQYQLVGNQCFINADNMAAQTIFDLGTQSHPGHCKHQAKLVLRKTAAFNALLSINEERLGQKKLAEWVEDYNDFIQVFSTTGDLIENAVASAAIRNMKFEAKAGRESNVDDFSHHQSEYESIAVRTKEEFPMPAVFKFTCEPFLGLAERTFEMRMSTIGNETLILRIKKMEQHQEQMGEEFQTKLQACFKDEDIEIDTFIGSFTS
ncbi:DUF2303 family protein [Vibrio fluvialis]|nr:DUF2303 family protein [Vibrio fluvialis]EKO3482264.1 DUF2303 family protein [Vibrio fluvialis]ELE5027155.1 DUF2303 family protein [Vibrio fluvialis]ELG2041940.1 DUF2303 family protein [Vibrio fluvialis]ELH4236343.1 DUF2303 family protein [Vibrio fluvialis]